MKCDNCGQPVETIGPIGPGEESRQVENGADWHLGGGYGMFNDSYADSFYGADNHRVLLCHDCVAGVFRVLPGVSDRFKGGHPYEGDEPCCEWGWTSER